MCCPWTAPFPIGLTPRHLSRAINQHDLYGRKNVKWNVAMRVPSLAIVLHRSVEVNLKDGIWPEGPWLLCVFKADFLIIESLSFSNMDWWYDNFFWIVKFVLRGSGCFSHKTSETVFLSTLSVKDRTPNFASSVRLWIALDISPVDMYLSDSLYSSTDRFALVLLIRSWIALLQQTLNLCPTLSVDRTVLQLYCYLRRHCPFFFLQEWDEHQIALWNNLKWHTGFHSRYQ